MQTYPDPDGIAETLDGRLVYVPSTLVLVSVLFLLGTGGEVTKEVIVCVR